MIGTLTDKLMRLLVIEDEPELLSGLTRALRKQGYSVDVSMDGEEGLYKATNTGYDAIVLDVMLPKMNGWQVLARVRESGDTPVLMLTARDGTADRVKGLDGGADDYLVKPFDLTELFARLRAIIRRGNRQSQPVLEIGKVTIDTTARKVLFEGKPVELTAREYAVLEYLAMQRGKIVSRSTFYEHLFDEEDSTLSNLIDVHVFNLRKKLGRDFIQTRRGLGYCIG